MAVVASNISEMPVDALRKRERKGSKSSLVSIPEMPHVDSDGEAELGAAFGSHASDVELSDEKLTVESWLMLRQSRSMTAPACGNSELTNAMADATDSEADSDGESDLPSVCRVDSNNSLLTQYSHIFESTPMRRDQQAALLRSRELTDDSFAIGNNKVFNFAQTVPSTVASICVRNTFIELVDDQKHAAPLRQPRSVTDPAHIASTLASMVDDSDDEDDDKEDEPAKEVAVEPASQVSAPQLPFVANAAAMQQQMMWMMMCGFAPSAMPAQLPTGLHGPPQAQGMDAAAFAAQAAAQAQLAVQMAEHNLAFTKAHAAAFTSSTSTMHVSDAAQVPVQIRNQGIKDRKQSERPRPQSDKVPDDATTVVLKNLPLNYKRNLLLKMLDYEGFSGEYDFVYMPIDFDTGAGLGYAFVNLVSVDVVPRFWKKFEGYNKWLFRSAKICAVGWSTPHQGLASHIRRFRNSPLMHKTVPDEYRPILLDAGSRVSFPPPTKELWAPNFINAGKKLKASQHGGA